MSPMSGYMPSRQARIMIVDDSAVMRSLLRSVIACDRRLEVAGTAIDGASALRAMDSLRPDLVLLDLKMAGFSGLDVLRWVKEQPHLACLIVIVLTSSNSETDIHEAYELGARSYLIKPLSINERLEVVNAIKAYWLELNMLPQSLSGADVSPAA